MRDWEQGRFAPDAAARADLAVIAREPEIMRRALEMTRPMRRCLRRIGLRRALAMGVAATNTATTGLL